MLILRRNATRDYLNFSAIAGLVSEPVAALQFFDRLYPQDNDQSPLQQLTAQLANLLPYDLEQTRLAEYKNIGPQWHDWRAVQAACLRAATAVLMGCVGRGRKRGQTKK